MFDAKLRILDGNPDPTNEAFERLGQLDIDIKNLFKGINKNELKKILLYHASNKVYFEDDLVCDKELDTLVGSDFKFETSSVICNEDGTFQVGNGNKDKDFWPLITETDILTCNGVIHVVDNVLLPMPVAELYDELYDEDP